MPKRYIKDVLPLGELNKYAQKGGGIGSLNAMPPYFARRPLTASRAMTLAAPVDAPETEAERDALEHLLIELSSEEWPDKPALLERTRALVRQAHGGRAPRVLDPFAGGGQCRWRHSAWAARPPHSTSTPSPTWRSSLRSSIRRNSADRQVRKSASRQISKSANGQITDHATRHTLPGMDTVEKSQTPQLVEDVRYLAEWAMAQAEVQIGDCYPVDEDGAVPVAYLWAKTVPCPHCGGEVPLIKRRWLDTQGDEPVAYRLIVDRKAKTYKVGIPRGQVAVDSKLERGTVCGATVECPYFGGADFFMSAIGPGLSVFSRYPRVERYDGSRVGVSDFLDLVRHEVAAFAIERIVGDEGFSERLDQPTQFHLLWRWGYGEWDVPDGEAVLLSTAVGIDLGVLMDRVGLVGKVKGKLRLLSPAARAGKLEKVVERVAAGGAVPLVDVLHAACLLWQADRQEDLAALVAARGGELWPVAQAVVELLSRDNAERKALMSLLGTRVDLEHRAQRWAETHRPPPRVEQLRLWEENIVDQ